MRSGNVSCFARGTHFLAAVWLAASLVACGGSGSSGSMGSGFVGGGGGGGTGGTGVSLKRLSADTFTNPQSQHNTEVEPGLGVFGSTLVTAFQVGRIFAGGAADIGFATSPDGGADLTNGLLPGITTFNGGTYNAVSDPTVVFDQAHGVWIIASLGIASHTDTVIVSRSPDALTWNAPIVVSSTADADKPWITCDNNSSSQFFGHCYIEWDDPSRPANGLVYMSTSVDGGLTWSAAVNTADMLAGVGGQPVVGANGLVVVPIMSADGMRMQAFTSANGGGSWTPSVMISTITDHLVAGNMRTSPLPSAAVDSVGRTYVVWQDCRFRTNCASNDIVLSTSADGLNWTAPVAIPIDGLTTSTFDHFIPALGVNPATSGGSAQLALTYYFYPNAACTASTCQLNAGFIASSDGGTTWGAAIILAGPMTLSWLANTSTGVMVGDYVATAYSGGQPHAVFAVAHTPTGNVLNEAIYTTVTALPQMDRTTHRVTPADRAITRQSDHPPRQFYDLDNEHPIPRRK